MKCRECKHTWKHHKVRGRCRKGCSCKALERKKTRKK